MSDLITRNAFTMGPGKIVHGSDSYHSAGDINVVETLVKVNVNSDQNGPGRKILVDHFIEVTFKPQSLWANLSKVYPSARIAPTVMRSRLAGTSPTPLLIHGEDGDLLTIPCPALTGLPSLMLGVDKGEFGEMKFTGVTTNSKILGATGALYTHALTGGTYGTPSLPDYLAAGRWDIDWKSSALAGNLLEAATITPDYSVEPVKAGLRTMDFRQSGIQFKVALVAGIDVSEHSGLVNDGDTLKYGQSDSTPAGDLVFTAASGHTFSLLAAMFGNFKKVWGMTNQRAHALDFETTPETGARVAWTTPA